jgi:hypothetical protein
MESHLHSLISFLPFLLNHLANCQLRRLSPFSHSRSKLCYEKQSVGQSISVSSTHLGFTTRFLLLSDSCGFVGVGRSLWWENVSAVYNYCWPSPAQSFSGPSPAGIVTIFTVSNSRLPQRGRQGPCIYIPQEQGDPVISPGTMFPFRLLLRLSQLPEIFVSFGDDPTGNTASSIVAHWFIVAEMCLQHRCVAMNAERSTSTPLFYCCTALRRHVTIYI